MTWTLFLDDERSPTWDLGSEVLVARDCEEAMKLVGEMGCPAVISFDHDLGSADGVVKPNAMNFLWWLIDEDLDGRLDLNAVKRVIVHSRNETGAKNIASLWDGYASNELETEVRAEIRPRQTLTK